MSKKKYLNILLKYFLALPLAICIAASVLLLAYRTYLQDKVRKQTAITLSHGIGSLEKITLGGVEQWVLIRGWNTSSPVLLFLHGGPGGGQIAISRFFQPELERHFVVVQWDQRGAGKSYNRNIPAESMNVEQFISDTHELVEMLRSRFHVPKIYLVGHSWGSMLGALTVSRYPDLFYAFVGVGQFVDDLETEQISYQYVLDKVAASGNRKAVRELEEIGPPPYDDYRKILVERRWLEKFGGVFHSPIGNLWLMGATSPDCSLLDGLRYNRGQIFSLKNMWDEVSHINLFEQVPRIGVPVYFFLGKYDFNTPSEIAERYYQKLEAPRGKQIIWFENSAHMIPYEEPEKFCDVLVNRVLKETSEERERMGRLASSATCNMKLENNARIL